MASIDTTTSAEFPSFQVGKLHWRVAAGCRERLFDAKGLRLAEWVKTGQARVVKTGPHCTVYRVILADIDFYVKHYRLFNARAWLRQMLRPAKARSEFERGLAVRACGVATVAPLGIGEPAAGPGDSFLLTRTLDAEPLGSFIETILPTLPREARRRVRVALAERLGEFMARMHRAGVVHHDLHAGNLLLRLDRAGLPELFLIDLHAVRVGRPLSWRGRRDNLIMLNRWFVLRSDRTDRLRFWRAYWQAWRGVPTTAREAHRQCRLGRELEAATWDSNRDFWRNRDRRCRVNNRYYRKPPSGTCVGHVLRELDGVDLSGFLNDPDEPFTREGVTLLKDSKSSTVAELALDVGAERRPVIYKRFRPTHWSEPLTALVRPTAALRSWVFGHGLRERGLPTPRPLLVLHRVRHGLLQEGYLLTEKVPDAVDLRTYLDRTLHMPLAERRPLVRRLIARIARLVFELHRRSLSQRDLKATNLILSSAPCPWSAIRESDTQGPFVWLIDLVGVSRHDDLSRERRVQNLSRLHASFLNHPALTRSDRLRFLAVYLRWGLAGKTGWKRWWHEVAKATEAKVERNRRRGRPLA